MRGLDGIRFCLFVAIIATLAAAAADAGDRVAVLDVLQSISGNWLEADFSADLEGPSKEGDVTAGQSARIAVEAAVPGYLTYLQVSSHGDMTLLRDSRTAATAAVAPFEVKPPLGQGYVLVFFSSQPLDRLFPGGSNRVELGSDAEHALAFKHALTTLADQNLRIARRLKQYMVVPKSDATEYTTRGITRTVEGAAGRAVAMPSHVEFEFDSDKLTERGKLDLDTFGEAMVGPLKARSVILEGHTDAMGAETYNADLSQRRAEAAKDYLVTSFGIPPSRLKAIGKGASDPLAPNDTEQNRSKNRRVQFVFSGAEKFRPD